MASFVERDHIGIFGKMNAGKSSVMNLLTQQETSIVDATPGTTSDTKISLMEIHGIGPVKIMDTAGADEMSELGEKKRKKILSDLKECDLILLIIDPSSEQFKTEQELLEQARELDKQILILFNLFFPEDQKKIDLASRKLPLVQFYKHLAIKANDPEQRILLVDFLLKNFRSKHLQQALLPFLNKDQYYVLNIPMDDETPSGRFLRPQVMVEEYITRNWAYPVSYRMNLSLARQSPQSPDNPERKRFDKFLENFHEKPAALITDSQAMDIVSRWCPKSIALTTFSIVMINYLSNGQLKDFVSGLSVLPDLKPDDRVLIVEACNHTRIGEDIGTVQIPRYMEKNYPGVRIEHNFGREFQENSRLKEYRLIIHCGGCMISPQKLTARFRDLESLGVPFTNYGLFLSYIHGKDSLRRALAPWKLSDLCDLLP